MRPVLATISLGLAFAALAVAAPATAEDSPQAMSAQADLHHAAVVIDTGDGVVRKLCLAFPEAEISGIEALRRVDTRPNRFETFSGKGSGVCMLCGVGCESGDCFCNPDRFWAYHRSAPGETTYKTSAVGASNTVVRDGDVEAWKWGTGSAPPKTTVSEVCNVPEPAPRASSAATTTSTASPTTTEPQSPTSTTPAPTPTPPPTSPPAAPGPAAAGTPTTSASLPATPAPPSELAEVTAPEVPEEEAAAPSAAEVKRSLGAEEGAAAEATEPEKSPNRGQFASMAAFGALIAALLVWRSRIRRANMRRVRPVR